MPDLNAWRVHSREAQTAGRAVSAWQRIQDSPTSISLARGDVDLDPQTVRIEWTTVHEKQGEGGEVAARGLVIFGVAGHPTVADTDIQRGDRFRLNGGNYHVIDVAGYPGEIQASAIRLTG